MPNWLRRSFIIAIAVSILLHIVAALFIVFFRIPMPGLFEAQPIEVFDAGGKMLVDQLVKGNRQIPKKADHIGIDDNAVTEETVVRPQRPQAPSRATPPSAPRTPRSQFTRNSLYAVDPSLFVMRQPQERAGKRSNLPRTAVSSTMNIESEAYLPEDYYPNYSYGAHTYLNVLRYPDIEYFVRLKRAFKQTWNPIPAAQQYVASGGRSDRIAVVLAVSVDPTGTMTELFVLRGSGDASYDQEALRTVRANAPFSAPPEKILKDGLLRMSWTFVMYM